MKSPDKWEEYLGHYSIEQIEGVIEEISKILNKYDERLLTKDSPIRLNARLEDIVKLTLSLTSHYYLNYQVANQNYDSHKPVSQLQELSNVLTRIGTQHVDIVFKVPGKTFSVDDKVVSQWIREQVLKAYHEFDFNMEQFGNAMFLLDAECNPLKSEVKSALLREYSKRPPSFSRFVYKFCDKIMEYLNEVFVLLPKEARYLSEQQLSFLYELLAVMGFESFEETFNTGEDPHSTDIDRLYQTLNRQRKLRH